MISLPFVDVNIPNDEGPQEFQILRDQDPSTVLWELNVWGQRGGGENPVKVRQRHDRECGRCGCSEHRLCEDCAWWPGCEAKMAIMRAPIQIACAKDSKQALHKPSDGSVSRGS